MGALAGRYVAEGRKENKSVKYDPVVHCNIYPHVRKIARNYEAIVTDESFACGYDSLFPIRRQWEFGRAGVPGI